MSGPHGSTCADCGASFAPSSYTTGYATTSVPRFARIRVRILGCDAGNRGTIAQGERIPNGERGIQAFPSFYEVEGHARAQRIDKLLGGKTVSIDGLIVATEERRICYVCCALLERETMIATGRTSLLYLSEEPAGERLGEFAPHVRQTIEGPYFYRYKLANWPSSAAFQIIGRVRESVGYGFGRRYPVKTFNFAGPDGYVWAGRCAGDSQLARCNRTRRKVA